MNPNKAKIKSGFWYYSFNKIAIVFVIITTLTWKMNCKQYNYINSFHCKWITQNNLLDFQVQITNYTNTIKNAALFQLVVPIANNSASENDYKLVMRSQTINRVNLTKIVEAKANLYLNQAELEKAIFLYKKLIQTKANDKKKTAIFKKNLAVAYLKKNELRKAEHLLLEAIKYMDQSNSKFDLLEAYTCLLHVYEKLKDAEKVFEFYSKRQLLHEELMKVKRAEKITKIKASYEAEKQKRKIAEQKLNLEKKDAFIKIQQVQVNQKTRQRNAIVLIAVLIVLILFIIIRQRMLRLKLQEENSRQRILACVNEIELLKNNQKIEALKTNQTFIQGEQKKLNDYLVNPLTDRELQILKYICEGLTNKEIAEKNTLSINTIKTHNKNIFDKLDVKNRAQAMVMVSSFELKSA